MNNLSAYKRTLFATSVAMLVVAVVSLVLMFALPEPINQYQSDDTSQQIGWAVGAVLSLIFIVAAFSLTILFDVSLLVLAARQHFANKNHATLLTVFHAIFTAVFGVASIMCFSAQPLLKTVFHVLIIAKFALTLFATVLDGLILGQLATQTE